MTDTTTEARPKTAGERYDELLRQVADSGGERLSLDLDAVVGERLVEAEDEVDLARAVARLRAEVDELRQQLANEVRTRRLVVVNDGGFESIVAEARNSFASVVVTSEGDPSVWSSVHATDEGQPSSGFYLAAGPNGVGSFQSYKTATDEGTEDEILDYQAILIVDAPRADDPFSDVRLDRAGLHFGGSA